jgi:probable H4MPT-linked C1 transfer pathway protein
MTDRVASVGWDIGGAHVKAALALRRTDGRYSIRSAIRPFEVWRAPDDLPGVLRRVAEDLGVGPDEPVGVTMTAELSDVFRTKREGVLSVLDAVGQALAGHRIHVLGVDGVLVELDAARRRPLDFAAANWVASAMFVAHRQRECILVDVGSTTTDIIPIRAGRIVCRGRTDPERLTSGELVYTGALRTNPNTLGGSAPLRGHACRVAAENFASMADVYVLLGDVSEEAYSCPTADGREKSCEDAADRLARTVCADGEMLTREEIVGLARWYAESQVRRVCDALSQVISRVDDVRDAPLVAVGVGAFIAAEAGRRLGLAAMHPEGLRESGGDALPAAAVAWLVAEGTRGP